MWVFRQAFGLLLTCIFLWISSQLWCLYALFPLNILDTYYVCMLFFLWKSLILMMFVCSFSFGNPWYLIWCLYVLFHLNILDTYDVCMIFFHWIFLILLMFECSFSSEYSWYLWCFYDHTNYCYSIVHGIHKGDKSTPFVLSIIFCDQTDVI